MKTDSNWLETEEIILNICPCMPAPEQLLARGLFPCAPLYPSLAVDMRVLDFVSHLFVNMPPNNTAWCKATEDFLEPMGYKLETKVITQC